MSLNFKYNYVFVKLGFNLYNIIFLYLYCIKNILNYINLELNGMNV